MQHSDPQCDLLHCGYTIYAAQPLPRRAGRRPDELADHAGSCAAARRLQLPAHLLWWQRISLACGSAAPPRSAPPSTAGALGALGAWAGLGDADAADADDSGDDSGTDADSVVSDGGPSAAAFDGAFDVFVLPPLKTACADEKAVPVPFFFFLTFFFLAPFVAHFFFFFFGAGTRLLNGLGGTTFATGTPASKR